MSSFRRFEDIDAWKKARELAKNIYKETTTPSFTDQWLKDQIRHALVSMTGCIAEGFEKGGSEFQHYLTGSKASCGELRNLLYLALDQNCVSQEAADRLQKEADAAARCIGGLAYYLKNNPSGYNARHRPNNNGQNGSTHGQYRQNIPVRTPEPAFQATGDDNIDF
jgi:four helix bundle protein